jgi:hypothetical protein
MQHTEKSTLKENWLGVFFLLELCVDALLVRFTFLRSNCGKHKAKASEKSALAMFLSGTPERL